MAASNLVAVVMVVRDGARCVDDAHALPTESPRSSLALSSLLSWAGDFSRCRPFLARGGPLPYPMGFRASTVILCPLTALLASQPILSSAISCLSKPITA